MKTSVRGSHRSACLLFVATHAGLLVVKVDNRGSFGRTVAFEKASIYKRLGAVELRDQRAAIMYLREAGLIALSAQEAVPHRQLDCVEPQILHNSLSSQETRSSHPRTKKRSRGVYQGSSGRDEGEDSGDDDCENRSEDFSRLSPEEHGRANGDAGVCSGRTRETTRSSRGQDSPETLTRRSHPPEGGMKAALAPVNDSCPKKLPGGGDKDDSEDTVVGGDGLVSSGVGIYGISYGGYLAAMAHFTHPDVFTCCWSAAPVTAWEVWHQKQVDGTRRVSIEISAPLLHAFVRRWKLRYLRLSRVLTRALP